MDESDKKHARRLRGLRFALRVLVIVVLVGWTCRLTGGFQYSTNLTRLPAACTVTTEETFTDKPDTAVGAEVKMPKDDPTLQKRVIREESSWVQFAHSALILGSQIAVLGLLVWGIVALTMHED